MLSLKRLTSLFSREKGLKKAAARRAQTRLSVEMLEARDGPAALNFVSPAAIWGGAAVDGAAQTAVRSLRSSNYGNMAYRKGSGFQYSEAYAALNYSASTGNKSINATSNAFTTNSNRSTEAVVRTTNNGYNYQYVTVRIDPSAYGEQQGQRVRVTLTAKFVSTIGQFNRAHASNGYSFYVNGQQYLGGTDTSKGTETISRTVYVNTTIGAKFQIAFQVHSYAGAYGSGTQNHNVANNDFYLGMSVQRV